MVQNSVNNCNRFTWRWQCNQFCYCIPRLRTNYFFIRSDSSPTSTTFFILITGMNPKASCGVLNPPLRGIVQLTNSATLRFRNWSFNNKTTYRFSLYLFYHVILKNQEKKQHMVVIIYITTISSMH
jgi:hypothetical protein